MKVGSTYQTCLDEADGSLLVQPILSLSNGCLYLGDLRKVLAYTSEFLVHGMVFGIDAVECQSSCILSVF